VPPAHRARIANDACKYASERNAGRTRCAVVAFNLGIYDGNSRNSAFLAAVGPSAAERFVTLDFQAPKGAEAARKFRFLSHNPAIANARKRV
jgi:hypothetical protein